MANNILLRDKIVTAAKELFSTKGYSETTMNDIIKSANTSKGNIYYHFENKESLFLYIFEQDVSSWNEKWKDYSSRFNDPIDKLYALAKFSAEIRFDNYFHKASEEFFTSAFKSEKTKIRINEIEEQYFNLFKQILIECLEMESIVIEKGKDINSLAYILMSCFDGLDYHDMESNGFSRLEMFKLTIDVFLNGIRRNFTS